ncbi:MAG: peptide deformylase [Bacteroidales bacterium]
MHLPIIAYGHTVLRMECEEVSANNEDIPAFINDMWETLKKSGGAGLAATQVNRSKKIFIVDSKLLYDDLSLKERNNLFAKDDQGITETFFNAEIVGKTDETWNEEEACLSIPGITEPVDRSWSITVEYQDANFKNHCKQFSGYTAKIIQHEYDHTIGVLFIDHLDPLKRRLLKNKLKQIKEGKVKTKYPIKFLKKEKKRI